MKKIPLLLVIIVFSAFYAVTPFAFAAKLEKSLGVLYSVITGSVEELIPKQSALILKDKDDGKETHIHVDQSTLSSLKVGDEITVKMQGSNCIVTDVRRN